MEYDVFISCKSEDYVFAEEIYNFFRANDVYAFLANKELRQLGESEYRKEISKALRSATHCIVMASKAEYIESTWVEYEWDMYINAKLKGFKPGGQIVTILKDVAVENIPMDLWKYESFQFDNYKDKILCYVETPAYLERKEQARLKAEEEEKKKKAKLLEEKRKEAIRKEISDNEADYNRFSATLVDLSKQIIEKRKKLGECSKICPVCNCDNSIENKFCDRCGWMFIPSFAVNPVTDKDQLFKAKSIWNDLCNRSKISAKEVESMLSKIKALEKQLSSSEKQINDKDKKIKQLQEKWSDTDKKYASVSLQLDKYKKAEKIAKEKKEQEFTLDRQRKIFKVGNVSFRMILVEAGSYIMGSSYENEEGFSDERPQHQVRLTNNYYIGEVPVTQALWRTVMGFNPSEFEAASSPVESVSWYKCREFLEKLSDMTGVKFRFPTEAEWEFAARGGNKSRGFKFSGSDKINEVAWFSENCRMPRNVAGKWPNELGLYDMSGNVMEWCSDWYESYGDSLQINPMGGSWGSCHVTRGGGWNTNFRFCRVAARSASASDFKSNKIGLRLALSE